MDGHFVPNLTIGPARREGAPSAHVQAVRRPPDDLAGRPLPRRIRRGRRGHHHRPPGGRPAPPPHHPAHQGRSARRPACRSIRRRPAKVLDYVLEDVDLVLVMSVNPGFGGQKFIASQLRKIEAIAKRIAKENLDVELEVDGGIDPETAPQAVDAGATALVAGTAVFRGGPDRLRRQHQGAQGRGMSGRRLGGRTRRRPQACARLAAFARSKRVAPAAQARRRAARSCRRATASAARRCLPDEFTSAARRSRSTISISPRSAPAAPLAEQLQGFSWLRDLAAAASREKGARLAEAVVGRWLLAHGTKRRRRLGAAPVGRAHPLLDGLRALHPVERRQRLPLGAAQHARARRPPPRCATPTRRRPGSTGSPPGAAWLRPACSSRAASPRVARGEAGLARALASAQFDDGGPGQPLAFRADPAGRPPRPAARLLSRRQADHPRRHRSGRRGIARGASRRHSWAMARCRAGRAAIPAKRRG